MREKSVWLAAAGILAVGVACWNALSPVAPDMPAAAVTPTVPQPAPVRAAASVAHPSSAPLPDDTPLSQQIEQLVATHDPENEYKAYWLIRDCEMFNREHDNLVYDQDEVTKNNSVLPYRRMNDSEKQHEAKLCDGMTERTRTSRFSYLADAVRAGVTGAVVQLADEGPFGDRSALKARPDDPLVQQWKAEVQDQLTKQAERGDLVTLNFLWPRSLTGDELVAKDPARAYRYSVAMGLIYKDVDGPQGIGATLYAPDGHLLQAISDLSAEQRTEQMAAARHIADIARERRLHAP